MDVENSAEIETHSHLEKEFNLILCRVINESFKDLSENFGSVICYVLEQKYNVKEEEIPEYIAEFSSCLQTMLGKEARMYIEKLITVKLYTKIRIRREHSQVEERDFAERVEYAKQRYIQRKKI